MRYKILITSAFLLGCFPSSAQNYCVSEVELKQPTSLARQSDVNLNPTHMERVANAAFPLLYNRETKQKDYKDRDTTRKVFWTLTDDFEILGPFDLKQTYYPRFESMGGFNFHYSDYSRRLLRDVSYNPVRQSLFFKTSGKYTPAGSQRWTSEQNIVEIPYNQDPKLFTQTPYSKEKAKVVNGSYGRALFLGNQTERWYPVGSMHPYEKNYYSYSKLPNLEGVWTINGDRKTYYKPKKQTPLYVSGESRLLKYWGRWDALRETADKSWYVTHVGRQRGEAYGTYTTTFQFKRNNHGVEVLNEKRFKADSFLPWRRTGSNQIYSNVLKRVIFPDKGRVLKSGRLSKIKHWPRKKLNYVGDFSGGKTALFKTQKGDLYFFDGLKASPVKTNGVVRKTKSYGVFRNLPVSGRAFFVHGKADLIEITENGLKIISKTDNMPLFGSLVENKRGDVFHFGREGIHQILKNSAIKVDWQIETKDFIDHNHVRFSPAYIPVWDSILFSTSPKTTNYERGENFDKIDRYFRLSECR